jgi:hypothetical protein
MNFAGYKSYNNQGRAIIDYVYLPEFDGDIFLGVIIIKNFKKAPFSRCIPPCAARELLRHRLLGWPNKISAASEALASFIIGRKNERISFRHFFEAIPRYLAYLKTLAS